MGSTTILQQQGKTMAATATRPVTIDNITINVPVGSMDRPCELGEAVFKLIQDPTNWKLPTTAFETFDPYKAADVAYALNWYLGGHEIETRWQADRIIYRVSSKGYYHYIGS